MPDPVRDGCERGVIVNITSVHEHQPRVGAAAYCAAKGGLGLLTKVAAWSSASTTSRSTPSRLGRSPPR
ncbi:MAG TPA: SDR family NAD(P)-dependent oxidoreductase [Modestobacter sp.]|nr:SDR family NAD(P)-dependent oxidoreductase [Modestobacter sp.]